VRWLKLPAAISGWRLVAVYVVLGTVSLSFLAFSALTSSAAAMREQVQGQLTNSAAVSSLFVRDQMEGLSGLVASFAARPSLRTALVDGNPAHFNRAVIADQLGQLDASEPIIAYSVMTDSTGRLFDIEPYDASVVGRDFSFRDWYRGAVATGKPYVSEAYQSAWGSHPLVVAIAVPVWSAGTTSPRSRLGMLVMAIRLETLNALTADFSSAEGLSLTVTDQRGQILGRTGAVPNTLTSLAADRRVADALNGQSGQVQQGSGSDQLLSAYAPVADLGWTVLVERKASIAFAQVYQLRNTVLLITAVLGLVLVAGAVLVTLALRRRERDAEQIRRLNGELAHRAAVTQAVLDNIGDGIAVADANGSLTFNPAAERIIGTKPVDGPPSEWSTTYGLFLPDTQTPYPANDLPMARARRGESVEQADLFVRHPGAPNGLSLSVTASPLRIDGKLAGGISIFRDVTAAKRAEAAIKKLNVELEDRIAERDATNKELEAFTYTVSHNLRAPLRAIHGFASILLEDHGEDIHGEARKHLDRVAASARQMGQLLDDLLRFSRLGRQPLHRRLVDIQAVARHACEQLAPALEGRQVDLIVADLPWCQGDSLLLEQVFINLVGNAIKYSKGRAPARIEVGSRLGDGGESVYYVKDNGAGFDMQYRDKLFGIFQRLHRSEDYEGTGVGLAIVQRIVQRHGGRIWAEAEVDKGATFFFTLGGDRQRHGKAA
jgi:signal transduction histidine kinase